MIYDYICLECSTKYEKKHAMNVRPEFICEACGGVLTRKPVPISFGIKGYRESNGYTRMEAPEKVSGKDFNSEISE